MARTSSSSTSFSSYMVSVTLALLLIYTSSSSAHLSTDFYDKSCPQLFGTVKSVVQSAIAKERRMGASLVRLFFHDCFVKGCDASILLEDTATFKGEQGAGPNNNSVRGYNVVAKIKSKLEKVCPGIVSCADIVVIAARDSTVLLGGPYWKVKLGRRDSKTANMNAASKSLPSDTSTVSQLIKRFKSKGLSATDMVALSGSHTIGQTKCKTFRARIYNETNIDKSFATMRQKMCPLTTGDDNLAPLDFQTPNVFDNNYYKNLIHKKGLLHSDQVLFSGESTDSLVRTYSNNPDIFFSDFAAAMVKMGDIDPRTGTRGEIRKKCSCPN
nr:class III peroxidase [Populus trichocarpa]